MYEEIEIELVADIVARLADAAPADQQQAMKAGARLFLDLCSAPEVQRIMLIDAPAVLGWERWRDRRDEVRPRRHRGDARSGGRRRGDPEQPLRPTAHVLLGALDEAALYISRAEDQAAAKADMYAVCDRLIDGIAR